MKKIVFLGDTHLSDRQISTRVDDTTETCLEKFEKVLGFAKLKDADIICTGDVFTHTLYSNKTRYRIKKALKDFQGAGLGFFSCAGNHSGDVEGIDSSTVIYRELGQFCIDGYINFLGEFDGVFKDYVIDEGYEDFPRMVIRGYSAYSELNTSDAGSVIGLVCHHWIMDAFGDSLVVYPDDMKKVFPNLRFIVAGHDHAYHDPYYSRDGVWVVRPGSMMRTDAGKSSDRIPCVELFTMGQGLTNYSWEQVPISCARPYSEVFYSEKRQADSESANALSRFVEQMQNNSGAVMDIVSAVREQLALVPAGDQGMIKNDLSQQGFLA